MVFGLLLLFGSFASANEYVRLFEAVAGGREPLQKSQQEALVKLQGKESAQTLNKAAAVMARYNLPAKAEAEFIRIFEKKFTRQESEEIARFLKSSAGIKYQREIQGLAREYSSALEKMGKEQERLIRAAVTPQ